MEQVLKHAPYLDLLVREKCHPKISRSIIEFGSKQLIDCICECLLNVVNRTVPVNPQERQKLRSAEAEITRLLQPQHKKAYTLKKRLLNLLRPHWFLKPVLRYMNNERQQKDGTRSLRSGRKTKPGSRISKSGRRSGKNTKIDG